MGFIESQKRAVKVLRNPSKYSSRHHSIALSYALFYALALLALWSTYLPFFFKWVAATFMSFFTVVLSFSYMSNFGDYQNRGLSAIECQEISNTELEGFIISRVVQVLLAMTLHNNYCAVSYSVTLALLLCLMKRGWFYVDAAKLLREAPKYRKHSCYLAGVEVVQTVALLTFMVLSVVDYYDR